VAGRGFLQWRRRLFYEQWRATNISEEKSKGAKIPPAVLLIAAFVVLVAIGIATT